jgi:hypothetical protein
MAAPTPLESATTSQQELWNEKCINRYTPTALFLANNGNPSSSRCAT